MTIVASVKVRDGLVLATDSMTQIQATGPSGPQVLKAYENAKKLFQIHELPVGVMTFGLGNIGQRSIEGLVLDFCRQRGGGNAVGDVAQQLFDFIKVTHYDPMFGGLPPADQPVLGFFVAGYSPAQPLPEEFEFLLPRDSAPRAVRPAAEFGVSWRGADVPFIRLWRGFDPQLIDRLAAKGIPQPDIDALLAGLETLAVYDGMPVQDAINFATYVLRTTIGYSQFTLGVPACGGPLQVATVLPSEEFRFISRPTLSIQP